MNRVQEWIAGRWRSVAHRSRRAFELLERPSRNWLLKAGVPIRKEFLILRCCEGSEAGGLFSEFRVLLGALEHFERWRFQYAGLRVDFANGGLFFDPIFGTNWWQYYFEPIDIGSGSGAAKTLVSPFRHQLFAEAGERLSRKRGFELIDRYIRPKAHIREKVEAYVREHFQDAYVVGIHYRGTNKSEEAPRVPYEQVHAAALDAIKGAAPARHKLFIATDEQAFLDYMLKLHPSGLLYRDMFRSVDGRPIDVVNDDSNHKKGEDAVLDCLLLSRCQHLVRTESNLSVCSTLFSPGMPQVRLNRCYD